jgi:hypothetical protein
MAPHSIIAESSSGIENATSEIKINYKVRQRRGPKTAVTRNKLMRRMIAEGDQLGKPTHDACMARLGASSATYYRVWRAIKNSQE